MKKWTKRIFWALVMLSAVLTCLVSAAVLILKTDQAQEFIQNTINDRIPGTVAWEKFDFSLFRGRFEIHRLSVKEPAENKAENRPAAAIERIFLSLDWRSLPRKELRIKDFQVDNPRLRVEIDSEGISNIQKAFPQPQEPEKDREPSEKTADAGLPLNIVIGSFRLENGALTYRGEKEDLDALLEQVYMAGDFDLSARSGNFTLKISKGEIKSPQVETPIKPFTVTAELNQAHNLKVSLSAGAPFFEIQCTGDVADPLGAPHLNLDIGFQAFLEEAQMGLKIEHPLSGKVKGNLKIKGGVENPIVVFSSDYGGGNLLGHRIEGATVDIALEDRVLSVEKMTVEAGSGVAELNADIRLKEAFPGGFLSAKTDFEKIAYDIALTVKGMMLEQLLPDAGGVKGTLNSRVTIAGSGIFPDRVQARAAATLDATNLSLNPLAKPIDIKFDARGGFKQNLATVEAMAAQIGSLKLRCLGEFDLSDHSVRANLNLTAPDLDRDLAPLGVTGVSGAVSLHGEVSGRLPKPALTARINGKKLRLNDITLGDLDLESVLEPSGLLQFKRLTLSNRGSLVEGIGGLRIFDDANPLASDFPLNLTLLLKNIKASDFIGQDIVSGSLDGRLEATGSLNALEMTGNLSARQVALPAARIGDVDMDWRFKGGSVDIRRATLNNNRSTLTIKGRALVLEPAQLKPLADPSFDFQVDASRLFVQDFIDAFTGQLSILARLTGSASKPSATLKIEGKGFDLGIQKIDQLTLASRVETDKLWIDSLKIGLVPGETIEADGWIGLDKTYAMNLSTRGIDLSSIDVIKARDIVAGRLLLNFSGKGSFDRPHVTGSVAVQDVLVNQKKMADMNLKVLLDQDQARISGDFDFGVEGFYHLRNKTFQAALSFQEVDLGPYFGLAGLADAGGAVSGVVEASGMAAGLDTIQGSANLENLLVVLNGKEMIRGDNIKVAFADNKLSIHRFQLNLLKEGRLDVSGDAKMNGPLDLKIDGRIPIRVAGVFVQDLSGAEGAMTVAGKISGEQEKPDIKATIAFDNIGMAIPEIAERLHGLNGMIEVTPESVRISDVAGMFGAGRFDITGNILLDAFKPQNISIQLNAHTLPVSIPDTLSLLLNAGIRLEGNEKQSRVQGEIVLLEGIYSKDIKINLIEGIGRKKRAKTVPPPEMDQPFLKNMSFDVAIKARRPFEVENNLASLQVRPDLKLIGKLNNPVVSGRAAIESGTVLYQKRQFTVKKGNIDFLNPYKIEPTIDIQSDLAIRDWIILMSIVGTPDDLNVEFSSKPPEEHGDILSLLLIGKTTKELIAGEGGASSSPAQILNAMIAATLGKRIKGATGLDIFEIEGAGSETVKVTMGKKLSKRTTLKYATETKEGAMVQRAIAEYKFLDNILLNGFQDSSGVYGGELQFMLKFR